MSLNLMPIEEYVAQALTGIADSAGEGGDPQKILPRAKSALAFGTALADVSTGNIAAALAAATASLNTANTDPAVASALQGLLAFGFSQLQLVSNFNSLVPLLGATVEAMVSNVSKGVITAANLEIAKYGSSQPAKA